MNYEDQTIVPYREGPNGRSVSALLQDRLSKTTVLRAQVHRWTTALRKRWWVPLLSFLIIAVPVIFYAVVKPPTFRSDAMMWLSGTLKLADERLYTEELTSYMGTQAELIKDPVMQFQAFEKVRARFPAIPAAKTNAFSINLPFSLTVRSSMKNSVLDLRATGPSPEATQTFLETLMGDYLAVKKASRERTSSEALAGLNDQIHEAEKKIQQQQNKMILFQMSNNISYLAERGSNNGAYLSKLAEVLSDMRTGQRLLGSLTPGEFKGLSEGPQVAMSDTAVPGEERGSLAPAWNTVASQTAYYQALQQLETLKAQRDEFSQVLRPTHSKIIKLNQQIAGLEQFLRTLQVEGEQRAQDQMATRKKSLALQTENLESQYHAWETNAAGASRKLAEYERMKEEMQQDQALYSHLLSLLQTVNLNQNLGLEPLVPLASASPGRPTLAKYSIAAAGFFLALLVGAGTFVFLEFLDDRFSSASEVSLHLSTDVLGQIPETRLAARKGIRFLLPGEDLQPAFAESFRNLRSSLLFLSEQKVQPKVILVTSAIPKEGKTTVACNLAATLARSGSRVLLMDGDFRRSSAHQIFHVGLKPGLLEVLRQGVSPARAIVPTADPNLSILPGGEVPNSTSDIFLQGRMDLLLQNLASQYNYIVIDCAPVLATDDAACLGPYTDGVFMVVRESYTSARMAREALARLHKRNVKVLGVVYNRAAPSTDYYCQYGSDYYSADNDRVPATVASVAEGTQTAG